MLFTTIRIATTTFPFKKRKRANFRLYRVKNIHDLSRKVQIHQLHRIKEVRKSVLFWDLCGIMSPGLL